MRERERKREREGERELVSHTKMEREAILDFLRFLRELPSSVEEFS